MRAFLGIALAIITRASPAFADSGANIAFSAQPMPYGPPISFEDLAMFQNFFSHPTSAALVFNNDFLKSLLTPSSPRRIPRAFGADLLQRRLLHVMAKRLGGMDFLRSRIDPIQESEQKKGSRALRLAAQKARIVLSKEIISECLEQEGAYRASMAIEKHKDDIPVATPRLSFYSESVTPEGKATLGLIAPHPFSLVRLEDYLLPSLRKPDSSHPPSLVPIGYLSNSDVHVVHFNDPQLAPDLIKTMTRILPEARVIAVLGGPATGKLDQVAATLLNMGVKSIVVESLGDIGEPLAQAVQNALKDGGYSVSITPADGALLPLLLGRLSKSESARQSGINIHSVEKRLHRLYKKFRVSGRENTRVRLQEPNRKKPVPNTEKSFRKPSPRQIQILNLLAQGHTNGEIAGNLGTSQHTVEVQVNQLYDNFGVVGRDRETLVQLAIEGGFIEDSPSSAKQRFISRLTPRQKEMLDLLAKGYTKKEIAETLGISELTVQYHMATLFKKFGAHSKQALVQRAIRNGVIQPPNHK